MGLCSSRSLDAQRVSRMLQENLKLDPASERDLIRSYRLFKKTDSNGDGRIQKSEFARAFKLEQDVFFDRLFSLIDTDESGYIDFREFVIVLGAFQLANATGRVRFAFRLLDLDDSGAISKDEFKACIQASVNMFRHRTKEGRARANVNDWRDKAPRDIYAAYKDLFAQLDSARGQSIMYEDFANICVRYPKLFTPVNYIWTSLRRYAVPAAELCKVIARAGYQGFFYNSMLEQGWPGVKFHAPALKLQERNVYMRSLSNLLRRKGTFMDEEEARMNTVSGSKSRRRSADRELRGGGSAPVVRKPTSPERKAKRSHSSTRRLRDDQGVVADDRRYTSRGDLRPYHTSETRREVEQERRFGRAASVATPAQVHARDRRPPPPRPKYCRQFSWGSDDPDSDLGKRELQASNSIDRAYREEYPPDEPDHESWLEDDMRQPSSSNMSSARTFEKQDSIEKIWEALQACPSARAAQHYSPRDYVPDEYYQRLDDGVYFKKNFSAAKSSGTTPPVYQHERRPY
jgi:Ca2+-binding EF-hand superfamily protein